MRMQSTNHPTVFELDARHWLGDLNRAARKTVTLSSVPEEAVDRIDAGGFDMVWLMGVWETGPKSRAYSIGDPDLHRDYDKALGTWKESDIAGSPYAVARYEPAAALGGRSGLAAFRAQLARRGIGLILDFIPNHTGLDHHWLEEHPGYFVGRPAPTGTASSEVGFLVETRAESRFVAHGRDPYFAPWRDTAQLDLRNLELRRALGATLEDIASMCDGVRCDMAMLVLENVFCRTWSGWVGPDCEAQGEFWAEIIPRIRRTRPRFVFIAEAYWGLEYRLQQLGFDFTYDKTLYDRIARDDVPGVAAHLDATLDFQTRSLRFLENHDEPRCRTLLPGERMQPSVVAAFTLPGARMFFDGQLEGRQVRTTVHLARRPDEPVDPELQKFYQRLLTCLKHPAMRLGAWQKLVPTHAEGAVHQCLFMKWDGGMHGAVIVAVNLGAGSAKVRVPIGHVGISGAKVRLVDGLGGDPLEDDGDRVIRDGFFLELAPWHRAIYEVTRVAPE